MTEQDGTEHRAGDVLARAVSGRTRIEEHAGARRGRASAFTFAAGAPGPASNTAPGPGRGSRPGRAEVLLGSSSRRLGRRLGPAAHRAPRGHATAALIRSASRRSRHRCARAAELDRVAHEPIARHGEQLVGPRCWLHFYWPLPSTPRHSRQNAAYTAWPRSGSPPVTGAHVTLGLLWARAGTRRAGRRPRPDSAPPAALPHAGIVAPGRPRASAAPDQLRRSRSPRNSWPPSADAPSAQRHSPSPVLPWQSAPVALAERTALFDARVQRGLARACPTTRHVMRLSQPTRGVSRARSASVRALRAAEPCLLISRRSWARYFLAGFQPDVLAVLAGPRLALAAFLASLVRVAAAVDAELAGALVDRRRALMTLQAGGLLSASPSNGHSRSTKAGCQPFWL